MVARGCHPILVVVFDAVFGRVQDPPLQFISRMNLKLGKEFDLQRDEYL